MTIPTFRVEIAEKIAEYRKENGLSQRAFGRLIGVSAPAVCKWEKGVCLPDVASLPLLARILGCKTDDFFIENGGPRH